MPGKITFDLNELYRKVFGPVAPPYPIGGIPDPKNLLPIKKITTGKGKISPLGTILRMPVELKIPGPDAKLFSLPNEPIVSISGSNEIVSTALNRGKKRGTTKERIYLNDYKINIRGIIINEEEDEYPDTIIRALRTILEHPGAIEIHCHTCMLWNINLAVVNSFRFPRDFDTQLRWCRYEIQLTSDEDFEKDFIGSNI